MLCRSPLRRYWDGQVWEIGFKNRRVGDAAAQEGVAEESGSGRTVKSRKQAIAIGLSEARKKGAKVPSRKSSRSSSKKR